MQFLTSQVRIGLALSLPVLFLLATMTVQAQDYAFTTNNGALTITGYTGNHVIMEG